MWGQSRNRADNSWENCLYNNTLGSLYRSFSFCMYGLSLVVLTANPQYQIKVAFGSKLLSCLHPLHLYLVSQLHLWKCQSGKKWPPRITWRARCSFSWGVVGLLTLVHLKIHTHTHTYSLVVSQDVSVVLILTMCLTILWFPLVNVQFRIKRGWKWNQSTNT